MTEETITRSQANDSSLAKTNAFSSDNISTDTNVSPYTTDKPCGCENKEGADVSRMIATPPYIYSLGRVHPRFPNQAVEKEYAQAIRQTSNTAGQSDHEAMRLTLSERHNRYLARQMCWLLTIEGLETYILQPRDSADFDLLIETLRSSPRPTDVDVVIGMRGPIAGPELCNGLMIPIVFFDQIYTFDVDSLLKSIPKPEKIAQKHFASISEEVFFRIMQMADNAGATDEHRAINYLAVRYPAIYAAAAEAYGANSSLTAVEARRSPLSVVRMVVEVIFSYTNRNTDVTDKYFVRVDVTEEFPFLVTKLSPYYDSKLR